MINDIPFYKDNAVVGFISVKPDDVIVRQHSYKSEYSENEVKAQRFTFQQALVTARPDGHTLLSTVFGVPNSEGTLLTDSYIFVKDNQFIFESSDRSNPQKLWRAIREDGLPIYICEDLGKLMEGVAT